MSTTQIFFIENNALSLILKQVDIENSGTTFIDYLSYRNLTIVLLYHSLESQEDILNLSKTSSANTSYSNSPTGSYVLSKLIEEKYIEKLVALGKSNYNYYKGVLASSKKMKRILQEIKNDK